jgi:LuxR family transcriptional regulator of csgAB operon
MHSKKKSKKVGPDFIPNAFINIVGQNMLQNELLLSFLKEETSLKGSCFPNMESIIQNDADESSILHVYILDCKNIDMKSLWTSIHECDCSNCSQCFFVLCNAEHASGIEKNAMDNGIHGIFYNNDSLPLITKGICAVLNGDIWYSRKTLNKLLMEKRSSSKSLAHPAVYRLTVREKQVLACIASGYTSQDISDELNISMHTVKTHIYNLYRKINATNRLQAAFWATKYL